MLFTATSRDIGEGFGASADDIGDRTGTLCDYAVPATLSDLGGLHVLAVMVGAWQPRRRLWQPFRYARVRSLLLGLLIGGCMLLELLVYENYRKKRQYGGQRGFDIFGNLAGYALCVEVARRLVGTKDLASWPAPDPIGWRSLVFTPRADRKSTLCGSCCDRRTVTRMHRGTLRLSEVVALLVPAQARRLGTQLATASLALVVFLQIVILVSKCAFDEGIWRASTPWYWAISAVAGEIPWVVLAFTGVACVGSLVVLGPMCVAQRAKDVIAAFRARSVEDHLTHGISAFNYEIHSLYQFLTVVNASVFRASLICLTAISSAFAAFVAYGIFSPKRGPVITASIFATLIVLTAVLLAFVLPFALCNAALAGIAFAVNAERGDIAFLQRRLQHVDPARAARLEMLADRLDSLAAFSSSMQASCGASFGGVVVTFTLIKGASLGFFSLMTFLVPLLIQSA